MASRTAHAFPVTGQEEEEPKCVRARTMLIVLLFGLGFSGLLFLPLWIGASTSTYGISVATAGRISSLQMGGIALVSLLFASRLKQFDSRATLAIGCVIIALANLIPLILPSLGGFIASRALSGLGEGTVLTMVHRAIAGTRDPGRTIVISNFFVLLVGMAGYPLIGNAGEPPDVLQLLFLSISAIAAVTAPICLAIRTPSVGERISRSTLAPRNFRLAAGAIFIFYVGEGGLWAFVAQIGMSTGLSIGAVGDILSWSFVLSLGGPLAAYLLMRRVGARPTFAGSLVGLGIVALMLGFSSDPDLFAYACYAFYFLFILAVVHSTAFTVNVDPSGKLIAVVPGLRTLGIAMGPMLCSFFIVDNDYWLVALVVSGLYLVSIACILAVGPSADQPG